MAYSPEMSLKSCQALRRIAWALDKPMTESLDVVINGITMFIDRKKVCDKCRDHSICLECVFSRKNHKVCGKLIQ